MCRTPSLEHSVEDDTGNNQQKHFVGCLTARSEKYACRENRCADNALTAQTCRPLLSCSALFRSLAPLLLLIRAAVRMQVTSSSAGPRVSTLRTSNDFGAGMLACGRPIMPRADGSSGTFHSLASIRLRTMDVHVLSSSGGRNSTRVALRCWEGCTLRRAGKISPALLRFGPGVYAVEQKQLPDLIFR